jgi:hypothetical protein
VILCLHFYHASVYPFGNAIGSLWKSRAERQPALALKLPQESDYYL